MDAARFAVCMRCHGTDEVMHSTLALMFQTSSNSFLRSWVRDVMCFLS